MKRTHLIYFLSLLIFSYSSFCWGDTKKDLAAVYLLYSQGQYENALTKLKTIKGDKDVTSITHYWRGRIYTKMQEYDVAAKEYKRAIRMDSKIEDIQYQLGQTQYAGQNLEPARVAFAKSKDAGYKPGACLYYMGFISQMLEENQLAEKHYQEIIAMKDDKDNVKKAAMFQLAELDYVKLVDKVKDKKKVKKQVVEKILPAMSKARDYKKEASLTKAIKVRMLALQKKHKIDLVKRMKNGRAIPKKAWSGYGKLEGEYDSNVILRADEATPTALNKDSGILKATGFTKYQYNLWRIFSFIPEIKANFNWHTRRRTDVKQNDQLAFDPALRNWWEHKLFGKMARALFEIEYNYTFQDNRSRNKYDFYASHFVFVLGEEFDLFPIGTSTVKIKLKERESYIYDQESQTFTVYLSQVVGFLKGYRLTVSITADFAAYNAPSSDSNTYTGTFSLAIPKKFFKYYSLDPSYTLTYEDTKRSRPQKGYQTTHNPSISIKRTWYTFDVNLTYSYTKKISKDRRTSAYTKHVVTLGATYNF